MTKTTTSRHKSFVLNIIKKLVLEQRLNYHTTKPEPELFNRASPVRITKQCLLRTFLRFVPHV
jgi:hypothetical protein